jgi:MFS family permease
MLQRSGRDGVWTPLESPCFRSFFIGQSVSVLGSWLQIVAEGWLVYRLTHSPAWLGIVAGAAVLPGLLLTLWGGQIADRCSRRHILMVTTTIGMVQSLLLAVLASGGWVQIQPWHVALLAAVAGANNAFAGPAFQAFLPELVARPAVTGAIALHSLLWNSARVAGPLLAALIIARWGAATCFLLNSISYVPALVALARVQLPSREVQQAARSCPWDGIHFVRHDPSVARGVALLAVTVCFGWCFQTLLPALADEQFGRGAAPVGALMAAVGVGCTVACLVTAVFGGETTRRTLVYGGAFVYAVALLVFASVRDLPLGLAAVGAAGFGLIVCGVNVNALLQASTPDHLRGRVMGVFSLLFTCLQPLGGLLAGCAAQHVGSTGTVRTAAAICLVATTALFFRGQEEPGVITEFEPVLEAA